MKHKFVMDENTVVSACSLEDERGNEDFTCANLWLNIASNCHRIVINDNLVNSYNRHSTRERNPGFKVIRIIQHLVAHADKIERLTYSPSYSWTSSVPQDDTPIVLLAVQSGAFLVTSDLRLRIKLESIGAPEVKSLRVLTPHEAIPFSRNV